jgi:linoleoyl-CoA desaturase
MKKIKFPQGSSSAFFTSLNSEVNRIIQNTRLIQNGKKLLWFKFGFYLTLHISSYILLYSHLTSGGPWLVLNYVFIGVTGLLITYNVSHDACHETFSKKKWLNNLLYQFTFNIQGTNAYLWKQRHINSHHLFPNVDGCDADIDNNPLIRLSPQHPLRKYQRFQHLYSIAIYSIYTLHWFLIKDFFYLTKKKVANLGHKKHPISEWVMLFVWKAIYTFFLIVIPMQLGYELKSILWAFFVMHVVDSLIFIHSLIATHLSMETLFPKANEHGFLPTDFYEHQLATSLDFHPNSKLVNWIFGGFNSHVAHHLYPKLPHTVYPYLTPIIQRKAKEFNVPYHELSLVGAIKSHYRYLYYSGR